MGATLAGCRAVAGAGRPDGALDLDAIDRGRRRAGAVPVGQLAGQPGRAARRPRAPRRRGAGPTACRCSATSATSSSPGTGRRARSSSTASTGSWPCTRSRSGRTWPACGPASTPATPSWCTYLRRGAQARRVDGARARCRPPAVAAWDDDAHVDEQRARYRRRLELHGRDAGGGRALDVLSCRRAVLPVGAGARRRRLGLRPPPGRRGRRAGQPRRVLRRRRRATSASPWCSPTTASSWWLDASGGPRDDQSVRRGSSANPMDHAARDRPRWATGVGGLLIAGGIIGGIASGCG